LIVILSDFCGALVDQWTRFNCLTSLEKSLARWEDTKAIESLLRFQTIISAAGMGELMLLRTAFSTQR
jgi:hypothetical protein